MPRATVLLPAKDSANYLQESVDSILKQNFADFEILLVTQKSKDDTEQLAEKLSSIDPRIRHIRDSGSGVGSALNKGLQLASGEFIFRHDADDIALPNRLDMQIHFLMMNLDIDILGTAAKTFGRVTTKFLMPENHEDILNTMLFSTPLLHPTVCFRSKFIEDYEIRYDESKGIAEDYLLWTSISDRAKFANLPQCSIYYRIHKDQITQINSNDIHISSNTIRANFLKSLYPFVDNSEIAFHQKIAERQPGLKIEEVSEWFEKILKSTHSNSQFSKPILSKYLEKRLLDLSIQSSFQVPGVENNRVLKSIVRIIPRNLRSTILDFMNA